MERRTIEEKKKILIGYIQKHPGCTSMDIKRNTKIKVERAYKSLKDAYGEAGVPLSKHLTKRSKEEQKNDVISFIKNNPNVTTSQIRDILMVNVPRVFGTILVAYKEANVEYPQREITSGVRDPKVIKRCLAYEKRIVSILKELGEVKPKVRTSKGIVDCLFKYDDRNFVVEIKDFRGRNNITKSQIKQLIEYMRDLNIKEGLIICPKHSFPKRKNSRNLFIGDSKINIISEEDLWGRSINQILR